MSYKSLKFLETIARTEERRCESKMRADLEKVTRMLCVLCKKLEGFAIEKHYPLIFSESLRAWWREHKANCRCWEKQNKQARGRRLKKKRELSGLDKRTKAYQRARRPSQGAMLKLIGS